MKSARLLGTWHYENAMVDCGCIIVTAGRNPLSIGEELYCEKHQRVAIVKQILPAQELEREALTAEVQA